MTQNLHHNVTLMMSPNHFRKDSMKLYNRFSDNQLKVKEDQCRILKNKKDPPAVRVEILINTNTCIVKILINTNTTEKLPETAVEFNLNFIKHLGGKTIICNVNAH